MRLTIVAGALTFAMLVVSPATGRAQAPSTGKAAKTMGPPPVQSGIYGFSGARSAIDSDPEGVVGECIWIFDADDKSQVAKGDCGEREPGKFRVVLKPGRYVIHGPGGNRRVEIKQGGWVQRQSFCSRSDRNAIWISLRYR